MNYFTIKDIENLSGIKAHTFRVWEQRYNICIPQRKDSNHRFYDSNDLKNILKISYLYHQGLKISRIAGYSVDEMNNAAETYFKLDKTKEHYISRLLEASIDFDEVKFENVFNEALAQNGIEVTIADIIYPYLERVGLLWLTDHVIPAQEHFTSNLINRKIILAIDKLEYHPKDNGRQIILFAPQKEHHEIPVLLLHFLLKKNGHQVIYFGVNANVSHLKYYTDEKPVTHLYFHMITNLTSQTPDEYVSMLVKEFPGKEIVISGPVANEVAVQFKNVRLLKSRGEVMKFIEA
ncbi:MAG TPA: MerR family transcriptional regulator [Segetibacter sp.]|jgi:DNA-binding transcriptional MerR regulator